MQENARFSLFLCAEVGKKAKKGGFVQKMPARCAKMPKL